MKQLVSLVLNVFCAIAITYLIFTAVNTLGKVVFVMAATPFGFEKMDQHYFRSDLYRYGTFFSGILLIWLFANAKNINLSMHLRNRKVALVSVKHAVYLFLSPALLFSLAFLVSFILAGFNFDFVNVDPNNCKANKLSLGSGLSIGVLISMIILAPLIEEYIFRGFLFDKLMKAIGQPHIIFVVISLFFTVLHTGLLFSYTMLILFIMSYIVCMIKHKTQNLTYCFIFHSGWNFFVVIKDNICL